MILIALGSNLPDHGRSSREIIEAALVLLDQPPLRLAARSRLWRTRPVPVSDQPWFVNAVAAIATELPPEALLESLHALERRFGRDRPAGEERNAARILDLDLIDYDGLVTAPGGKVDLPHPRAAQRAFVLKPLAEIAPAWRHPRDGRPIAELIAALDSGQMGEPLDG